MIGLSKARHLDYMALKQRSTIVSEAAFMGLAKGKEENFHLVSSIGQANQLAFLYSPSFSPQNNSKDTKRRNGVACLSFRQQASPLQPVTVRLFFLICLY